ncbi:hypothetical protein V7149_22770, partial [Bacillus sp. JJ1503]
ELVEENGVIFAKDIFRFNRKATLPDGTILGEFEGTGYVPNIYQRFISYGIEFSKHILEAGALK